MRKNIAKPIRKTAACALALSLFLLAGIQGARAENVHLYDADGDGQLNERDVTVFLHTAAGLDSVSTAHVAAFRRAGQAAALLRYLSSREGAALTGPQDGMDGTDTATGARDFIMERLMLDLAPYEAELADYSLKTYDGIATAHEVFSRMAAAFNDSAADAVRDCADTLRRELADSDAAVQQAKPPQKQFNWKEIASLYRAFEGGLSEAVAKSAVISITETNGKVYSVALEFPFFDDIASGGTRKQLLSARTALAYLNTLYDAAGVFTEYEPYPFSTAYLSTVIHPLYGDYLIKNGWYDARSHGTRRHTGTDITAPARTEIHSVTDGIVLFIGYADTPGNYVIIRDPYGFEYHYYHMIEESKNVFEGQIVRQGDVIGLVGNTGNSVANHLHLAVVSPENTYINPYDMFLEAGITPIRIDE